MPVKPLSANQQGLLTEANGETLPSKVGGNPVSYLILLLLSILQIEREDVIYLKKVVGIYKITNTKNGKAYIGLSRNCQRRWYDHRSHSKTSLKAENLNKPLYLAMRKYGVDSFIFEILEECQEHELQEKEVSWIERFDTYKHGYNATHGGDSIPESARLREERHGMAKLTKEDVIFCRKEYQKGSRSKDIWALLYSDKIAFSGFQNMWHGRTWKTVMPEVFESRVHTRKRVDDKLIEDILQYHRENEVSINKVSQHFKGRAGYGTVYNIIKTSGEETYSKRK